MGLKNTGEVQPFEDDRIERDFFVYASRLAWCGELQSEKPVWVVGVRSSQDANSPRTTSPPAVIRHSRVKRSAGTHSMVVGGGKMSFNRGLPDTWRKKDTGGV